MIRPSAVFQRLRRPPPGRGVFALTFAHPESREARRLSETLA